jgi:hypothetical protein
MSIYAGVQRNECDPVLDEPCDEVSNTVILRQSPNGMEEERVKAEEYVVASIAGFGNDIVCHIQADQGSVDFRSSCLELEPYYITIGCCFGREFPLN